MVQPRSIRSVGWGIAALAACGCHGKLPEQHAAVLEGFSFGWEHFNHRLSQLSVNAGLDATSIVVIGGTSTTSQVPEPLVDPCDPVHCNEFPFLDDANVEARWAVVDTTAVALIPMSASLEVSRDGATATATGALPEGAKGAGVAVLTGLSLATDHPLSGGPSCYNPAYGWHPRQLTVTLGDVAVRDDGTVTVDVSATFAAGKTFDPDRECIDAVNDQAVVDFDVQLLAVVGDTTVETQPLSSSAAYAFSGNSIAPEPQDDPAAQTLSFTAADPVMGFSSVDFRFDPDRTDDRGAYLRTLGWWAEPGGSANAVATNYSPGTQLEDFAFRFDGEVVAIEHGGTVTRGTSTGSFPAELDDAGSGVVNSLAH